MTHPNPDPGRRASLGALAGSFALATQPVTADTILTDAKGLIEDRVGIPRKDGTLPAYLARPDGHSGLLPIIVVVQEIFGVHAHIQDLCRRLAHQGYFAIAPELYFRQGDPAKVSDIAVLMSSIVSKVPDAQVLEDLDATLAWGAAHGGDDSRAGMTGFCWGGRIVWLYAAQRSSLKAGVAWYGRLDGARNPVTPRQALDLAATLTTPVLGLYGGKDSGIPLDSQVQPMQQALAKAHSRSQIVVYPEAGHAFNADYRPSYLADTARDGWSRMLAWFAANGVKP